MSKTAYVTAAKPKVGGAIYSAPLGTALPTDATTDLHANFKALGFVSEDGVKNANSPSSENLKAWGGATVNTLQKEKEDTFTYKLVEALNVDVLKEVYGADNVTGDLETGITITANSQEMQEHSIVIDMVLKDGILKRIVIPQAKVSEVGEIVYADSENVGYETTLTALPDEQGNTHYEYIKKATAKAKKSTAGGASQ